MSRPATFDHLKKKKPLEKRVPIYLDDETVERMQLAEQMHSTMPNEETQAELDAASAALKESTVTMVFRSIGRKAYEKLVSEHPPTDEQIAEAEKDNEPKPAYNIDTFAPALVLKSCVEPKMTEDEVLVIFEGDDETPAWNTTEILEIWLAALEVNTQRRVVSLGKGYG